MKKLLLPFKLKLLALLLMLIYACENTSREKDPAGLSLGGGSVGGGWYILCSQIADSLITAFPDTDIRVETGGGITNLTKVSAGEYDIGVTMNSAFTDALAGDGIYAQSGALSQVSGLLGLGHIYMGIFLVRIDAPYVSVRQIVEQKLPIRLVTATKGSAAALITDHILAAYGITAKDIESWGGSVAYVSYAEGSVLMQDNEADVYCNPILPSTIDLAEIVSLKTLKIDKKVINALRRKHNYSSKPISPKDYDFVAEEMQAITQNPVLVVNSRLNENSVYRIVQSICDDPEKIRSVGDEYARWKPEDAASVSGGPLHNGAIKYYKEKGWID